MRAIFIINRKSGRPRDLARLEELIRRSSPALREESGIVYSEEAAELDRIIPQAAAAGDSLIVAVGGDGTVHEVARRLIGTDLTLGILPTGSGNGLARHMSISTDPHTALDTLSEEVVESIDVAYVNNEPFFAICGMGFDALIAHRFAAVGRRGLEGYLRGAFHTIRTFRSEDYEVTVDGSRTVEHAFLIAVANASQYGNDARIAPLASMQDGLLDVSIVKEASMRTMLAIPQLFRGTLHETTQVKMIRATAATIRRTGAGPAHIDGEPVTLAADLQFGVQPRSLRVVVPRASIGRL